MKSQLFIASKIKVGFNKRSDTYTGKLGYVIGYDGKKWRKEASWEGWREKFNSPEEIHAMKTKQFNDQVERQKQQYKSYIDYYKKNPNYDSYKKYAEMSEGEFLAQNHLDSFDKWEKNNRFYLGRVSDDEGIKPVEFDNVPTEGFVLNKKAGGYSTGWNHRATYCRVYDPRGFEFEINIPNLLFILQETNSYKGKGLEGQFVYAWEGKDLVLLPANCEEYKQSQGYTKLQSGKIGVKDLIPGCSYKTKKQVDLIYLGKFNWYSLDYITRRKYYDKEISTDKYYIFYDEKNDKNRRNGRGYNYTGNYVIVSGLASFASRNSDTPVSNYADLMSEFSKSKYATKPISLEAEIAELKYNDQEEERKNSHWLDKTYYFEQPNGEFNSYIIFANYDWEGNYNKKFVGFTLCRQSRITFNDNKLVIKREYNHDQGRKYTKEELEAMNFKKLFVNLESGNKVLLENY